MAFDLVVQGYKYDGVTFAIPLKEPKDAAKAQPMAGLELRDYVLDGGEIHVFLNEENRINSDPGYWYAVKCLPLPHDDQTSERIGTLKLRQMNDKDTPLQTLELALEGLDESHVLDRVVGETLMLHAQTFGAGPFTPPPSRASAKPR